MILDQFGNVISRNQFEEANELTLRAWKENDDKTMGIGFFKLMELRESCGVKTIWVNGVK